jgi:hypothetical protein
MRTTIAFLLLASPLVSLAADRGTQAPRNGDLVASRTVTLAAPASAIERKPVSFTWALDPFAALSAATPFTAESREFWTQVDADELVRGFELDASAAGPVLRISPIAGAAPVSSDKLRISRNGQTIANAQSFAHAASAEQLQKAGMDVSRGSAVVQIEPALGKGHFKLQLPEAKGRYLVHVFEPNSTFVLQAQTSAANLLAGDRLQVTAMLGNKGTAMSVSSMAGLLVSPSGKNYELSFVKSGGAYRALATVPNDAASQPGLWEVQVLAGALDNGTRIQRDARTSIAVAQPTARLAGNYGFDPVRLKFTAPVQVGTPGRYELRATLFATGPDGIARPVSEAHSAAWFEKGSSTLSLGFDRAHVPTGFGAPYEVRYLELKDQSRMSQLETRELALSSASR